MALFKTNAIRTESDGREKRIGEAISSQPIADVLKRPNQFLQEKMIQAVGEKG